MAKNLVKTGGILAGSGCLFGLAPLIISFAAAAVGSDIGNTLHWYTFFTAPAGAIVVIVGLVIAIVGASKSTASDFVESAEVSNESAEVSEANESGVAAEAKPVELPPLPVGLARTIKITYAFGFVVILVSCVMRVTIFQPFSGILTLFDLVPVFFAGWFVFLARNAHEGLGFLRLYQSQLVVSIAGCVVGLWPLVTLDTSLQLLAFGDVDVFQLVGSTITSLIPAVASLASLVFAGVVRAMYRRGLKSS
jgi:hypothetical protein